MAVAYELYNRSSLKQTPHQDFIGKWRVDYLAFSQPENAHKTPLIVLGGAFQNFNSYKYCVENILNEVPVILVDLPSLGNNDQLAPMALDGGSAEKRAAPLRSECERARPARLSPQSGCRVSRR